MIVHCRHPFLNDFSILVINIPYQSNNSAQSSHVVYPLFANQTKKTIAVYLFELPRLDNGKCIFTTGHPNDNFTPHDKLGCIELFTFGAGKMITAMHQAAVLWKEDCEVNRVKFRDSLTLLLRSVVNESEIEMKKGKDLSNDKLVEFASSLLESFKTQNLDDTLMSSCSEARHFWTITMSCMLPMVCKTTARIAKLGIGRKLPYELLSPYEMHCEYLVAILHAYRCMFSAEDACLLVAEKMCEECSKDDERWAVKFLTGLDCFNVDDAHNGESIEKILEYMTQATGATKRLGKSLDVARELVCKAYDVKDYQCTSLTLSENFTASETFWKESGYFKMFNDIMDYDLLTMKPSSDIITLEDMAMVADFANGSTQLSDVLQKIHCNTPIDSIFQFDL